MLLSLCETVASRLRSDGMKAEVVSVTIKDYELQSVSHQTVLRAPTNITSELYLQACRLFDELWDGAPIRLLGVRHKPCFQRRKRAAVCPCLTIRIMINWKDGPGGG